MKPDLDPTSRWILLAMLPTFLALIVIGVVAYTSGLYYVLAFVVVLVLVDLAAIVYGLTHEPPPTPPLIPNDSFSWSEPFDPDDKRITKRGS